jgi:hypothetical protein
MLGLIITIALLPEPMRKSLEELEREACDPTASLIPAPA